ncbi:MAG: hypothetical protein RIT45_2785 [Pseudomonadota bacterium]
MDVVRQRATGVLLQHRRDLGMATEAEMRGAQADRHHLDLGEQSGEPRQTRRVGEGGVAAPGEAAVRQCVERLDPRVLVAQHLLGALGPSARRRDGAKPTLGRRQAHR